MNRLQNDVLLYIGWILDSEVLQHRFWQYLSKEIRDTKDY